MVCFGLDEVAMFISMHTCVVIQLKFKIAHFLTMVCTTWHI